MRMAGKWLIETAELASFRKMDVESLKKFLTLQADYYRVPYGRFDEKHPRRSVFFG